MSSGSKEYIINNIIQYGGIIIVIPFPNLIIFEVGVLFY